MFCQCCSTCGQRCEGGVEHIQDISNAIKDKLEETQDDIMDFYEDMVEDVMDRLGHMVAPLFQQKLASVSVQTLEFMAPKCGETAVQKMVEKYPKLKDVDKAVTQVDMTSQATDAATGAVMSQKEAVLEFCGDVVERLQAGFDCVTAAWKTLRKVLVVLLRALRDGVNSAVDAIKARVPECCQCCLFTTIGFDIAVFVKECYDALVDIVEEFVKGCMREKGVPKAITNKIEWSDINPDKDIGAPKSKNEDFQTRKQDVMDGKSKFADHFAKDAAQKVEPKRTWQEHFEEEAAAKREEANRRNEEKAPNQQVMQVTGNVNL